MARVAAPPRSLRNSRQMFHALRRILARPLGQRVKPVGVIRHVPGVVQLLADDHVHQPQRERQVAARIDREMLVRQLAGPIANRIDGVKPRAVPACFDNEGPQVYVGGEHVCSPGDDQLGVAKLLGLRAVAQAERGH